MSSQPTSREPEENEPASVLNLPDDIWNQKPDGTSCSKRAPATSADVELTFQPPITNIEKAEQSSTFAGAADERFSRTNHLVSPLHPTGRMYSPSRMKDWSRCPLLATLRRKVDVKGEWTPYLTMGRALDEVLDTWIRGKLSQDECLAKGMLILKSQYEENDTWRLTTLEAMLTKISIMGFNANLVGTGNLPISINESLGSSRPDLVVKLPSGGLGIIDRKLKFKLDTQWLPRELADYEVDDQFWHYAYEAELYFGAPVEWCQVQLFIASPRGKFYPHQWPIDPERLKFWVRGAAQTWKDMENEECGIRPLVAKWSGCRTRFGPCDYFDYCHNPVQRELFYTERGSTSKGDQE